MIKDRDLADALSRVADGFNEYYTCIDGFEVVFNQVKCTALYQCGSEQPLECKVTPQQRDYFLKTGYWVVYCD